MKVVTHLDGAKRREERVERRFPLCSSPPETRVREQFDGSSAPLDWPSGRGGGRMTERSALQKQTKRAGACDVTPPGTHSFHAALPFPRVHPALGAENRSTQAYSACGKTLALDSTCCLHLSQARCRSDSSPGLWVSSPEAELSCTSQTYL